LGFIGNDQLPKRPNLTPSGNVSTAGLTLSPDLATPGSFQGNIFINGVSVPVAVVNGVVYGPDGKIAGTAGSRLANLNTGDITNTFTTADLAALKANFFSAPITALNENNPGGPVTIGTPQGSTIQATLKLTNTTSGNTEVLLPGDVWSITVTGPVGSHVYVD